MSDFTDSLPSGSARLSLMGRDGLWIILGNRFPINSEKPSVALCRCGHSAKKPFCDGSHKTCGFVAKETAPVGD